MINIKSAKIIKPAFNAFPAERFNERFFPFPVTEFSIEVVPVFIPISALAFKGTVAMNTWFPTLFATPVPLPPESQVTNLPAKMTSSVSDAICVH
jgi:hypothetical protein